METKEDNRICRAKITAPIDDSYDFEAIAIPTENGQMKYSYENDEYFMQVLRTGKENIDTSRMDSGLPLFDNHPWEASALNTLGISVDYEFKPEGVAMRCKFGSRADEALRNDVKNGVIKTVSIEGTIQSYSIERQTGMMPKYYAERWTPESISFAPVPQDIGAQIEVKRAIEKQLKPKQTSFFNSLINKF